MEPALIGGRYRPLGVLGVGGMSIVHRAVDTISGRHVAVKTFSTVNAPGHADLRLRREIATLRSLEHPGIVRVLDAEAGDRAQRYMVTELIAGGSLAARISRGPLDERETAQIGADVAEALAYVHSRGVIHRDIKPANVMLADAPDGSVRGRLIDFGIAVAADDTRMTTDGSTAGTASYLSPEQVTGAPLQPRSDIYALGLILIECITGERCFPGGDIGAAVARLFRDPAQPDVDSAILAALLQEMTARDPAQRPDAVNVAASLRAVADGSLTEEVLAFASASAPRRHPGIAAALAAAAVAAVVAGAGFGLASRSDSAEGSTLPPVPVTAVQETASSSSTSGAAAPAPAEADAAAAPTTADAADRPVTEVPHVETDALDAPQAAAVDETAPDDQPQEPPIETRPAEPAPIGPAPGAEPKPKKTKAQKEERGADRP